MPDLIEQPTSPQTLFGLRPSFKRLRAHAVRTQSKPQHCCAGGGRPTGTHTRGFARRTSAANCCIHCHPKIRPAATASVSIPIRCSKPFRATIKLCLSYQERIASGDLPANIGFGLLRQCVVTFLVSSLPPLPAVALPSTSGLSRWCSGHLFPSATECEDASKGPMPTHLAAVDDDRSVFLVFEVNATS